MTPIATLKHAATKALDGSAQTSGQAIEVLAKASLSYGTTTIASLLRDAAAVLGVTHAELTEVNSQVVNAAGYMTDCTQRATKPMRWELVG